MNWIRLTEFYAIEIDREWQEIVVEIENNFFAPDSDNYKNLTKLLKTGVNVPIVGGLFGGLPSVASRASKIKDRPTLLFLNLPGTLETQNPPSAADKALERIRDYAIPLVPLFGVSGCGKTRTAIEMLSKNWGFYFNGSGTDLGSDDLLELAMDVTQRAQRENRAFGDNTIVHIRTSALVLSRVIILDICLNIAELEKRTFTCKHWMLLQVGFRAMGFTDIFHDLFKAIASKIKMDTVDFDDMSIVVGDRFMRLHKRLQQITIHTPSSGFGDKILLVIDEAQNLAKMEFGSFLSQTLPSEAERQPGAAFNDNYMRPILSPVVHGLYQITVNRGLYCVVPCGTGLSIFDMKWLEDSPPGPKGYQEALSLFTDFKGWESLEQVQDYRNLVRRSLPHADSRHIFDIRVPDESVPELFERLRGRFRPILSAIGKQRSM